MTDEIDRIHDRLNSLEETSARRGDQLAMLSGDVREIRALLETYATTKAVYDSLAPIQEGMRDLQQSGVLLAREVTTISHSFEELTQQVGKVIAMHEQSLQDKAAEDRAKAERERLAAEKREKEATEKHTAEMAAVRAESEERIKAIREEQKNKRLINRLRQNWLPFAGAMIGVLVGIGGIIAALVKFYEWLASHWKTP